MKSRPVNQLMSKLKHPACLTSYDLDNFITFKFGIS